MTIFDEKYFGYIASAYGITFLVFAGLIIWVLAMHRNYRHQLSRLEEMGIKRRSSANHARDKQS